MNQAINPRCLATQIMYQVAHKKQHLKPVLQQMLPKTLQPQDKAWIQNLCYQTIRNHQNLTARWQKFITKPLKDAIVAELLTLSMAQKLHLETPDHALVNEAIQAAKKLKKAWATGLINKVLKLAINDREFEPKNDEQRYNHPQWWIDQLKKDWPHNWQQIIHANNQKPPLWIRTQNSSQTMSGKPHKHLKSAWLLIEQSAKVNQAIETGQCSVQDAAAQYAAPLLQPQTGEKILDACAAPGGKSGHLLELNSTIELDIVDQDPDRLKLVHDNLKRLSLKAARVITGDATEPNTWFKLPKYDKILLDVPCSAAGVARRNPDIKLHRTPEHLKKLTQLQQNILQQIAPLVKAGGQILYATCSVFRAENERQINKFLKANPNYEEVNMHIDDAKDCKYGQQILTGTDNMDGFYYCLLQRNS